MANDKVSKLLKVGFIILAVIGYFAYITSYATEFSKAFGGTQEVTQDPDFSSELAAARQVCNESIKIAMGFHDGTPPSLSMESEEIPVAQDICIESIRYSIELYKSWPGIDGNPSPSHKTALTVVNQFESKGWTYGWASGDYLGVLKDMMLKHREMHKW